MDSHVQRVAEDGQHCIVSYQWYSEEWVVHVAFLLGRVCRPGLLLRGLRSSGNDR